MSRHWITRGVAAAMACCTTTLNCTVVSSMDNTPSRKGSTARMKKATTESLGGLERYLTSVSTDKPIYHAGEKVYVRGVLLNAANHKPLAGGQSATATVEIKGPKGDVVASGSASAENSVWGCAWEVPQDEAGGEYSIRVSYPWDGHAPAERKFDIRAYRAPRLKSQITFLRDGYGPGDKVSATLDVKRAEGGAPEGAKVTVTARVDGIEIKGGTGKVDADGLCHVSFELPRQIPRGEGTLALVIEDGGVVETASKTIPILLQTVDLQIFPEGGDLLAGYRNRVYVQAKQPNGKPADLVAKLMSKQSSDTPITEFRTEHEGRGRFEFIPVAGRDYYLAISQPAGIKTLYPLPKCKGEGAVVHADKDVYAKGEPIAVHVGSTKDYRVTLAKREVEVASLKISRSSTTDSRVGILHPLSFNVPSDLDGVLTLTVWDEKGMPLAERLIFRQPANPLNISISSDRQSYVPGERTNLTVKATDSHGKPVSAVVGVTVADDSVLEMVEKREQAPRLPVMLFLEPEVKDLADAQVYLDPKNAKAPLATDLLLGTQGWRRFALMDLTKFVEKNGDEARRAVALKIQSEVDGMRAAGAGGDAMLAVRGMPMGGMKAMWFQAPKSAPMPVPMPSPIAAAPPMGMPMAPQPRQQLAMAMPVAADMAMLPPQAVLPPPPLPGAMGRINFAGKDFEMQNAIRSEFAQKKRAQIFDKEMAASRSPGADLIVVREFAHQVRKNRKPTDRLDFSETLYWNAGVKTSAKTGEAKISFGLNDSVSTFRVFADAFAGDGAIGASNLAVSSIQPFYAEAKLPLEVTSGDRILLPINLINATGNKLSTVSLKVDLKGDFKLTEMLKSPGEIGAGNRVRLIQPINVGLVNGLKDFTLDAKAGVYEDKITRKLSVKPKGFPIETSFGGMLEPGKTVTHTIIIPPGVVAGSLVSNTAVYPTPLANLTEALQRMIQDPNGCFEQTSSTSYPLTMAQQYFLSHTGIDPKLIEQSRQKLDAGYKRLIGFWCPDKGYEWFGENPGHEALTAFGLLHFSDMAQVREVDQNMIATTRAWLLKQKDGQGGFTRKRRSLHSWTEDKNDSNAYIVWALLESGQKADELKPELASLKTAATNSQNNYAVALAANSFYLAGDKAEAIKLMDRLAAKQKADGSEGGIKSSIVGSEGESLQVEGTALTTLAWLREPAYAGNVEKSIKFLADSCKAGRYGSTQATVLALRAIVTYDKQRARPKAPGKVQLYVDGQSIGDWADFDQSTQGAIKLPDLTELLTTGEHKLTLRMEGGGPMPYSLAVKYNALTPESDDQCKLDVSVKMAQDKLVEGNATEANVTVINKIKEVVPTPVAIIGLPGGLEPRHDQLKELVKKGKIDAYEVRGREVVLYWRDLPAEAKVEVPISLIAAVPGTYTGPASRAYLYYTDEHKRWVDGVKVEIAAK
jgi:alpha-2-macroglobulin-like protein